jgi:hypothetical protein
MASKANPSWTEPQKKVHGQIAQAIDIVIPYFGPEIPVLDNHTDEMLCDELGVVKAAGKAFELAENALKERFKARLGQRKLLRATKYEATVRDSTRTALNQGKVKSFLERADEHNIDIQVLLDYVISKQVQVPNDVFFPEPKEGEEEEQKTNISNFFSSTPVASLFVEPIE